MFLIETIQPDNAEGNVADVFNLFPPQVGVPEPLRVYSASPEMLQRQGEVIKYYFSHPNMEFQVQAAIRFLAASYFGHEYCVGLNAGILKSAGVTESELEEIKTNPACVFEEKDAALLTFVSKAIAAPESICEADVSKAKAAGWTDTDLFDAIAQGSQMSAAGIVYKTFKK